MERQRKHPERNMEMLLGLIQATVSFKIATCMPGQTFIHLKPTINHLPQTHSQTVPIWK